MRRSDLEVLISDAGRLLREPEVIVIGSQAILASYSEGLPEEVVRSVEVDILPLDDPTEEKADLIDAFLGEASSYHERRGVYAQGVGPRTAALPEGWRDRLVRVETEAVVGMCRQWS